jgi:hypothetical protein
MLVQKRRTALRGGFSLGLKVEKWLTSEVRLQNVNVLFCGIPDFQMQPGNGNFSRRSDIPK